MNPAYVVAEINNWWSSTPPQEASTIPCAITRFRMPPDGNRPTPANTGSHRVSGYRLPRTTGRHRRPIPGTPLLPHNVAHQLRTGRGRGLMQKLSDTGHGAAADRHRQQQRHRSRGRAADRVIGVRPRWNLTTPRQDCGNPEHRIGDRDRSGRYRRRWHPGAAAAGGAGGRRYRQPASAAGRHGWRRWKRRRWWWLVRPAPIWRRPHRILSSRRRRRQVAGNAAPWRRWRRRWRWW